MIPQTDDPTSLSSFNMELLMTSITNNDNIIRSFHEKCDENERLRADLQSITETANQVRQMYATEKEQRERLHLENTEMQFKLNTLENRLAAISNERINNETLHQQTVAEFEFQVEKSQKDYFELCQKFVEQGNILQANCLSTAQLTRKCTQIRDKLQSNGIKCEKVIAKSPKRKTIDVERIKSKTSSTMTDPMVIPTEIVTKCEKSTQYQQSKATRSTCTSAFIRSTDASTNTDDLDDQLDSVVVNLLDKMCPFPMQLSPLHDEQEVQHSPKLMKSTQTTQIELRTQGTITNMCNVRKDVNYVEAGRSKEIYDNIALDKVKKEDISSPFGSMSNLWWPYLANRSDLLQSLATRPSTDQQFQLNPKLLQIWQMLGELMFTMVGQGNIFSTDNSLKDISFIQRMKHELQNLIDDQAKDDALIGNIGTFDVDEQSRDSIESYNSGKIVISKVRDLSEVLDECLSNEENSIDESRMNVTKIQNELSSNITTGTIRIANTPLRSLIEKTNNDRMTVPLTPASPETIAVISREHIESENDFKVPKRKPLDSPMRKTKKRKIVSERISVSFVDLSNSIDLQVPKKDLFSSIFGEDFDDDDDDEHIENDRIAEILGSFHLPMALSPIKHLDVVELMESIECPAETIDPSPVETETATRPIETEAQPSFEETEVTLSSIEAEVAPSPIETEIPNSIGTEVEQGPIEREVTPSPIETEIRPKPIESEVAPSPIEAEVTPSPIETEVTPVSIATETPLMPIETEPFVDYYSPASPKPEDQIEFECAPIIPSDTLYTSHDQQQSIEPKPISSDSVIDQIILSYSPNLQHKLSFGSNPTQSYLLASLRNAIETYCHAGEWSSVTVTQCIEKMLSLSRHPKYLAVSILEVIEDTHEKLSLECTPPSPALQPSHQKCLVLYARLTKCIPGFDKYMKAVLERRLFTFNQNQSILAMTNLAHFFIALNDIAQPADKTEMRLFIYKCLYYFTHKSTPLVFTVLMAHPFILPHANSVEFLDDPLNRTIVSVLTNIQYSIETRDKSFKKSEMFLTLKSRYGYFADKIFSIDDVLVYCIDCLRNNQLKNVDYAIILLAKRKGYEFGVQNIIQKYLIPLLHQYFTMNLTSNTEHDQQIAMILFIIGSIVKTAPLDSNIDDYFNMFLTTLNATDRKIIQESAISAMCQLSRFGTTRIYKHLSTWKPNYEISIQLKAILNTIVYKKSIQFWFNK